MARKQEYGNESITSLKGADRVRKRPAVIFGSDGVEGCAHSIFEIVSNSIDEARDGHGDTINVTRCKGAGGHSGKIAGWKRCWLCSMGQGFQSEANGADHELHVRA